MAATIASAIVVVASIGAPAHAVTDGSTIAIEHTFYRGADGDPLAVDVYRRSDGVVAPALIAIHGGGWRHGSRSSWARLAVDFVEAGFVVFAVDYRLAPPTGEARYPAPQKDLAAALRWVREEGPSYGADAGSVSAIGSSAGGHLALMLASDPGSGLAAVAAWSPPVALARLPRPVRASARVYLGCSRRTCPSRWRAASPIHAVASHLPPTFVANATDEIVPLAPARAYERRLTDALVPHDLMIVEGSAHGMRLGTRGMVEATIAFLHDHRSP